MPSWKKIIVSGSDAELNQLTATSFGGNISGSITSTGSFGRVSTGKVRASQLRLSKNDTEASDTTLTMTDFGGGNMLTIANGSRSLKFDGRNNQGVAGLYFDNSNTGMLGSKSSTSTVPGLKFKNDEDTGIGRADADQLSLITGGTEAFRVTSILISGSAASTGSFGKVQSTILNSTGDITSTDGHISLNSGKIFTAGGAEPKFEMSTNAGSAVRIHTSEGSYISVGANFSAFGVGHTSTGAHKLRVDGRGTLRPFGIAENNTVIFDVDNAGNITGSGNLTIAGDITAQNFIVSSSVTSITYQSLSGSTIFGDTADDTHQFTGSLLVTGSNLTIDSVGTVSGSSTSTGSFGTLKTHANSSSSFGGRLKITGDIIPENDNKWRLGVLAGFGAWKEIHGYQLNLNNGTITGQNGGDIHLKAGSGPTGQLFLARSGGGNGVGVHTNSPNSNTFHVAASGGIFSENNISGSSISTGSFGRLAVDSRAIIGEAYIGQWEAAANYAIFANSELDQTAAGNYSILAQNNGKTLINAATSRDISFRINNSEKAVIDSSGNFIIDGNVSGSSTSTGSFGSLMIGGGHFTSASLASGGSGGGSGISNVVEDSSPQLGGDLDLNSNDITGTGNINIAGNLTVLGTTSTISTTNIKIGDPFGFFATGSAGTNVDGGIIIQSGSAVDSGSAMYHDISTERWSVAKGIASTATTVTDSEWQGYVATVFTSSGSPVGESPKYGVGEIHIDENGDIFIYS